MTIEQLDSTKVLISLCNEDMTNFSLEFDTMSFFDEHSRKVLSRLLRLACNKAGISCRDKAVLVEALPHDSGCFLLVTIMEKSNTRKKYRIKKTQSVRCYRFDDCEALLSAAAGLCSPPLYTGLNSVWLYSGHYYLIFDGPCISRHTDSALSEYAQRLHSSRAFTARVKECGRLICDGDALATIANPAG